MGSTVCVRWAKISSRVFIAMYATMCYTSHVHLVQCTLMKEFILTVAMLATEIIMDLFTRYKILEDPKSFNIIDDNHDINHYYIQNYFNEVINYISIKLLTSYWKNIFDSIKLVNRYWSRIFSIGKVK